MSKQEQKGERTPLIETEQTSGGISGFADHLLPKRESSSLTPLDLQPPPAMTSEHTSFGDLSPSETDTDLSQDTKSDTSNVSSSNGQCSSIARGNVLQTNEDASPSSDKNSKETEKNNISLNKEGNMIIHGTRDGLNIDQTGFTELHSGNTRDTSNVKLQSQNILGLSSAETKQSDSDSVYCDCKSEMSLNLTPNIRGQTDEQTSTSVININENSNEEEKESKDEDAAVSRSNSSICTCPQSTQTSLMDFCRICHCEGDAELGPLIAPCYCRGSLRYVHQACLQQWIKSSDTKHCELCSYHFVMDSKLKPFHKWKKLTMSTSERRKILCSVMFHIIAITCVIWSLYVLIERTASEIQEGKLQWPFWTKLVVVAIGFTGGLVFMYVQCKVYVQLWRRLKAFNRVIYVKNNSPPEASADDDTIADAGSIASEVDEPRTVTQTNADGVVVVEICPRDN